jgi:hypothetical protein
MDHQKTTILLIFGTLSLGGCGGHPMRPKLNSKDKGQMSKLNEYTDNFKSNLTCIFLSVMAHMSGRKIWINFEAPQQYIRHINPWKKCSNLM